MSKLVTVFGATGNQGSSVIHSILAHPVLSKEFKIRGITRDPTKDNAKALADKGVTMLKADLEDAASVSKAIEGSFAVFAVTNYWEIPSKEREVNQGKRIADACKEHGVKQLIWSSLPHVTTLTNGKLPNVPHFDGKAEIEQYIKSIGTPASFVLPGFFMSNIRTMAQKSEDGSTYTLYFPFPSSTTIPFFDAGSDTGNFVAGVMAHYPDSLGNSYQAATGMFTGDETCEAFEAATGKKMTFVGLDSESYKKNLPAPVAEELLENMLLIKDYGYYGPTPQGAAEAIAESLKVTVHPPTTLKQFFEKNGPW